MKFITRPQEVEAVILTPELVQAHMEAGTGPFGLELRCYLYRPGGIVHLYRIGDPFGFTADVGQWLVSSGDSIVPMESGAFHQKYVQAV